MYHKQQRSKIFNKILDSSSVIESHEELCKCARRTLLFSFDDEERLALASSRARLGMELVKTPDDLPKNFGSYYRSRKNSKPAIFKTPVTTTIPVTERITSKYSSLDKNTYGNSSIAHQIYSEKCPIEIRQKEMFNCTYQKCQMEYCRCQEYSQHRDSILKSNKMSEERHKKFKFRNNVMRFTDSFTMTPKFADACCEVYHPLNRRPKTSEARVSTSDEAIRDRIQTQASKYYSTTKKRNCDTDETHDKQIRDHETDDDDEAVREAPVCSDNEKFINSAPTNEPKDTHSGAADGNNLKNDEYHRRNLYNEGISDSIAETSDPQFLRRSKRISAKKCSERADLRTSHCPKKLCNKKNCSGVYEKCVGEREPWIPYAHGPQSKYHNACQKPDKRVDFRLHEDCGRHGSVNCDMVPIRGHGNAMFLCDHQCIKLPKKLLTSVRDIKFANKLSI